MKTPGVYIQELDAFGNSVVPVPTAVPAFIGYTEQTSYDGKSLLNKAVKVTSLAEFLQIFGSTAPEVKYKLSATILPERLTELQAEVSGTTKIVDDLTEALKATNLSANDKAKLSAQLKDAQAEVKEAQDALKLANTNKELAALIKAQGDVEKAGSNPSDAQVKALDDARAAIAVVRANASFESHGYAYDLSPKGINYRLYAAIKFFYQNSGADCYVMSIGTYDYAKTAIKDTTAFTDAITLLEKEPEPTMLVIPDAVEVQDPTQDDTNFLARYSNAYSLQMAMINHCGKMMNRVAVLDIPGAYVEPATGDKSFEVFRNQVEPENPKYNSYAAVYYPWLHTTVYQASEVSFKNIDKDSYPEVLKLLQNEYTDLNTGKIDVRMESTIDMFDAANNASNTQLQNADKVLNNLSKSYALLMKNIKKHLNLMAPSAAMAGLYTSVDNNDGVWKAPANIGVQSTIMPAINIDHAQQEDLNVPISGKSVCAIRAFTGYGNLVWGARTLDGNSNDWRYINIRRTLIFIEQSVKDAAKAYVFAPNDASTWVNVKSMISNFLIGLWNQGALVGPKPADAFSVSVGLGITMTNDDIQNGRMRVSVKVALSHPAEFIEITFQQQQQVA